MVKNEQILLFSDAAVNVSPDENALFDIGNQTLRFAKMLELPCKMVLLSYSTHGSNDSPQIDIIRRATQRLQQTHISDLQVIIEGEMQFDAAFSQTVRMKKSSSTKFQGHANIFIFPDLNSGNIGYKIAQYLGSYQAIGPILLGLNKPVNDLSRGASIDDIFQVALITALQALQKRT
jgi:phosphate acetyltransferase